MFGVIGELMSKGTGTPAVFTSAWTTTGRCIATGRRIVSAAGLLLALSALSASANTRTLEIYNIHTKSTDAVTFKTDGRYDSDGLKRLNHVMRDWRLDIETKMDPELFDLLWEIKTELGHTGPIHLISGHRSQKTNNMLRRTRGGQAKRSLHIRGSAADVFFPGINLKRLRNAALVKQQGGVGYYPRSGQPFVHVDTGRVRHWPRISRNKLAAILKRGTPKVPTRQVRETAVAVLKAPTPRQKPVDALTRQPEPFRLAAIDEAKASRTATAAKPVNAVSSATSVGQNTDEYRPGDWGESWLAPSRPKTSPMPRLKPTLVANAAPRRLSTDLAPSSLTGYADASRGAVSPSGRLLDGSSTTLAGMLANAERLSALSSLGAETDDATYSPSAPAPQITAKIQPAAAANPVAQLAARPVARKPGEPARPIYTASLSPAGFLTPRNPHNGRFRAVLFAPAHAHVFEPTPRISQSLALTSEHDSGLAFRGGLFAATEVGAFAPVRTEEGYRVSSLRVVEAGHDQRSGLVAMARRAYAWLTGS